MIVSERENECETDVGYADGYYFGNAPQNVVPFLAFSCPAEGYEKRVADHEYAYGDENERYCEEGELRCPHRKPRCRGEGHVEQHKECR